MRTVKAAYNKRMIHWGCTNQFQDTAKPEPLKQYWVWVPNRCNQTKTFPRQAYTQYESSIFGNNGLLLPCTGKYKTAFDKWFQLLFKTG